MKIAIALNAGYVNNNLPFGSTMFVFNKGQKIFYFEAAGYHVISHLDNVLGGFICSDGDFLLNFIDIEVYRNSRIDKIIL